ncbi:MAG: ADP-ribosylation factor-like protein [Candidatus Helarchaeota archaeon]
MSGSRKKKLVIVGLDNAGKSTIILTMKRQLGPHNLIDLQPTKGLSTESFETDDITYHVFDFGGQEAYRNRYLEKPYYFESTDNLVYVIDIQDAERFELSLKYLEEIIKILHKLAEKPDCSVFFHKFDPELADSEKMQERSRELRKKIRMIFNNYRLNTKVYHTSIYTVFERVQVM